MINDTNPAWHNGKFCQVKDLCIQVTDLGLLRSYGVYDVVSIKNNRALAIEHHIERLLAGCKYYYISINYTADDIVNVIKQLSQQFTTDIQIWIIVTRGVPDSYGIHDVINSPPQLMILANQYVSICKGDTLSLCIPKKVYRIPDSSINQKYKNFARQDFTIGQIEASLRGFDYALLLDSTGLVTEGQHFNIAIIKDGRVLSPSRNRLSGITMSIVETLCKEHNIEFEYCDITEDMLRDADDMFASTTAGGIISISTVDTKNFVETKLQQRIKELYHQAWEQDRYSTRM